MDDMQRTALIQRMRSAMMEKLMDLVGEQRGKHAIVDVLPLAWLAAADVAGRTIGVSVKQGHLHPLAAPIVTMVAGAMLSAAAKDGAEPAGVTPQFSYDWNALLHGTKPL